MVGLMAFSRRPLLLLARSERRRRARLNDNSGQKTIIFDLPCTLNRTLWYPQRKPRNAWGAQASNIYMHECIMLRTCAGPHMSLLMNQALANNSYG